MKFEIDDIITVDNEDYYVANELVLNEEKYIFLLKTNENEELSEEFDIVKLNSDNTLSPIENDILFAELYEQFMGNFKRK